MNIGLARIPGPRAASAQVSEEGRLDSDGGDAFTGNGGCGVLVDSLAGPCRLANALASGALRLLSLRERERGGEREREGERE